ncbi:hypothetical protein GW17_00042077, partial [Ensete ventricosum]
GFPDTEDRTLHPRSIRSRSQGEPRFAGRAQAEAYLKTLHYQRAVARFYNQKVHLRPISMGDLVLRKAEVSNPKHSCGKLALIWEGPYCYIQIIRDGITL